MKHMTEITTKAGNTIECYGELLEDSNFHVVCEHEEDDYTHCDGNPNSDNYTFANWEEVCEYLQTEVDSDIVEISAV